MPPRITTHSERWRRLAGAHGAAAQKNDPEDQQSRIGTDACFAVKIAALRSPRYQHVSRRIRLDTAKFWVAISRQSRASASIDETTAADPKRLRTGRGLVFHMIYTEGVGFEPTSRGHTC
jgi:hypothetical protein